MKKRLLLSILIGSITISACTFSRNDFGSEASVELDPSSDISLPTETPTPFLPFNSTGTVDLNQGGDNVLTPTITFTPTPEIPWGDFPGPTKESAIEIPPPVQQINFPSQVVNILLLGSDEAPHRYGHRTDTIMILSLDTDSKKVTLISIPRDLYVYIPGLQVERINVADIFGGPEMVHQTILYNFGIEIDHWVRVNFTGFENAVDLLGGIDVQVGKHLSDECGGIHYTYNPGTYHMDGFTALCYVRMRKTSSDFDRIRRQQEVIRALFQRALSLDGLTKMPQFYSEFRSLVSGDIGLDDLLPLLPLAKDVASGSARLNGISIDQTMVTPWRVPTTGAAVLLPQREKIEEFLHTAFND